MEFLLVLSAILSAVTGAFGARESEARAGQPAPTHSVAAARAVATVPVPAVRIARPAVFAPSISQHPVPDAPRPVAVPLYADRLIE